jgi:phage protein D
MAAPSLRFAPEYQVRINGQAVPAPLRASISSLSYQTGLDGADRVELTLVNENLRWLDHPLFALDNQLAVSLGYAPDSLDQVFVGEIVGHNAGFPSSGAPTLTVVAQDRRHRLQQGTKVRWFAVPVPCRGNWPLPDIAVAAMVSLERELIPIFDPIGAALSFLVSGAEIAVAQGKPDAMQKIVRKQVSESDFDFLRRIAHENGWEVVIDHDDPQGGRKLHFLSLADHLAPDLTLKYGHSLIEFTPRITMVGQVAAISVRFWVPEIKTDFTVVVSWDWDRNSLDVSISPGFGTPNESSGTNKSIMLVEEPVTQQSAPRVILSKLLARLNQRLTGSGSTVGDLRIRAGKVLRLEGVGEQFGGLYRVTSATHTIDSGGYRTSFEVRKEIWFGSIPLLEQGAVRVRGLHDG